MTYSLDLLFEAAEAGPQLAQIFVKAHTKDEDGHILITPHCVSLPEFENQVDRLIRELEAIRKKARRAFSI